MTPDSFVTGVDFVSVPTEDLDRAAEFETGTVTIAIIHCEAFGIEFSPHQVPIALHVDDVAVARTELESRGVTFMGDTIDSGVCLQALFRDPDGNVLDLHHRYAPKK